MLLKHSDGTKQTFIRYDILERKMLMNKISFTKYPEQY